MKKIFIGLFFCFLFTPAIVWGSPQPSDTIQSQYVVQQSTQTVDAKETIAPQTIIDKNSIAGMKDSDLIPQQRGYCSWHGGVCGCRNGRTICCDGEYSPSCGC